MAQRKRPTNNAAFHHLGILSKVNRSFRCVDNAILHFNSRLRKEIFPVHNAVRGADLSRFSFGSKQYKVIAYGLPVFYKNVVQMRQLVYQWLIFYSVAERNIVNRM